MITHRKAARRRADRSSCLVIQQLGWGIDDCLKFSRSNLENFEISAKILAFVLSSIGVMIVMAESPDNLSVASDRLLLASIMFLLSAIIFIKTTRGLIREIQIDRKRNSLLLGTRDSCGRFRTSRAYSLDDLVSAFIRRACKKDSLATLHVTTRADEFPIGILKGTETDLLPVLDYLVEQRSDTVVDWRCPASIATREVIRHELR